MHFTILTATYNRATTLRRTYESICAQGYRDFDWLIIDDGSTDDTRSVVEAWQREGRIHEINYVYKENGGKHTAWRLGLEHAKGPYLTEIDSDDELVPEALDIFARHWRALEARTDYERFFEIRALCNKADGTPLSPQRFPEDAWVSTYLDAIFLHRIYFEQAASWHLARLKDGAPVPATFLYDDKSKSFTEGVRWGRAARKYKTLFINEVVRIYHLDGGNSICRSNDLKRFYRDIVGDKYFIEENIDYFRQWPWFFLRSMLRFTSNSLIVGHGLGEQYTHWENAPSRLLYLSTLPAGVLVYAGKKALLRMGLYR